MSDSAQLITASDLQALAKRLRLKVYYDVGNTDASDQESAIRQGRSTALTEIADTIDEITQLDSTLTQEDLGSWRR